MRFQERAAEAIRESGGRMTGQRQLLLDLLAQSQNDVDAEGLHDQATLRDPVISLPTIYRTLNTLEEAGLITPHYVSSEHDRKRYRVSGEKPQDVFHFTCQSCGRVIPFASPLIANLKAELSTQLDADVTKICTCVSGLCADCRKE